MANRRNFRRIARRSRRRAPRRTGGLFVKEVLVSSIPESAITQVPVSIMSNVPKFSIWRPRTIRVQATASDSNTMPAIQVVMYNSSGEKVSSSQVRLLNVIRTNIYCHYPRTAEWFSPIQDDNKAILFDVRVLCTSTSKPSTRVGVIINVTVQVKNEIPSIECPSNLRSIPLVPFEHIGLEALDVNAIHGDE